MDGHYQRRERESSRINKFPFIKISPLSLLKMGKWFLQRPMDRPTIFILPLSLPLSSDDDADNDEVVITAAAAARSEPILTPGRSERGARYTTLFPERNIRLS